MRDIDSLMAEPVQDLHTRTSSHTPAVISSGDFKYSPDPDHPVLETVFDFDPILFVSKALSLDASPEAFFVAGVGGFLTAIKRDLWVTVVPLSKMAETGSTIGGFLGSAVAPAVLAKSPSTFVRPGQHIWVPFGSAPLVMVCHSKMEVASRADENEFGAWIYRACFAKQDFVYLFLIIFICFYYVWFSLKIYLKML